MGAPNLPSLKQNIYVLQLQLLKQKYTNKQQQLYKY